MPSTIANERVLKLRLFRYFFTLIYIVRRNGKDGAGATFPEHRNDAQMLHTTRILAQAWNVPVPGRGSCKIIVTMIISIYIYVHV